MSISLHFQPRAPMSPAAIRTLLGTIGEELTGAPCPLEEEWRVPGEDLEHGKACYESRLRGPIGVTGRERIENGEGNPYDRYGYQLFFELSMERKGRPARVQISAWNWAAQLDKLELSFDGLDAAELSRMRQRLRRELGVETDRCWSPATVGTLTAFFLAGGLRDEALALAHEGLDRTDASTFGRDELLAFIARLEGVGLERRLRESPARLDAWREALQAPPDGFPRAQVEAVLDQLQPYDPAHEAPSALTPWFSHPDWPLPRVEGLPLQGFRRHEQGLGPAHSDPSVLHRIGSALHGLGQTAWCSDRAPPPRVEGDDRSVGVARVARWDPSGGLRSWVRLGVDRREPRYEQTVWSFFAGPVTGDLLLVIEKRTWPEGQSFSSTPSLHGQAAWARGSRVFLEQVETVLAAVSPFHWLPCEADACFPTTPLVEPDWLREGLTLPPRAFAARVVEAAPLPTKDRAFALDALRACHCPAPNRGLCPHVEGVLQASRAARQLGMQHARPLRSQHEQFANESALSAACVALEGGKLPIVERHARSVLQHLRLAAAMR